MVGVERTIGSAYSNTFTLPGTESSKALTLLSSALPKQAGDSDTIIWQVTKGTVREARCRLGWTHFCGRRLHALGRRSAQPLHADRGRPGQPGRQDGVCDRGLHETGAGDPEERRPPFIDLVKAVQAPGLEVAVGGQAIEQATQTPPSNSEAIGIGAAAVIILIAFGSLLGMALPLIAASAALGTAVFSSVCSRTCWASAR